MTSFPDTPSEEPRKRKGFSPLLLSLSIALHLVFFVVAGFLVVQEIALKRKLQFAPPPPVESPARELEHRVTLQKKRNAGAAPAQARRIAVAGMASRIALPEMPDMPDAPFAPGRMGGLGGAGLGAAFGFGSGTGMGVGGLGKDGLGLTMFGMRSSGDVVVVIDVSGSMVTGMKTRQSYDELEQEAIRAIRMLGQNSKFNVITFASEVFPFEKELVSASLSAKETAIRWLKSYSPCLLIPKGEEKASKELFLSGRGERHQGTSSKAALVAAFTMKPTSILFVSDGAPLDASTANILETVQGLQGKRSNKVVINTIAYRADSGQLFLRQLAEQNGGSYKVVE